MEYINDQMMMEMSDLTLFIDRMVDPTRGVMKLSKYGKLRPRLKTMMPVNRLPSQKKSILGAMKRNLNAPKLSNNNLSSVKRSRRCRP